VHVTKRRLANADDVLVAREHRHVAQELVKWRSELILRISAYTWIRQFCGSRSAERRDC